MSSTPGHGSATPSNPNFASPANTRSNMVRSVPQAHGWSALPPHYAIPAEAPSLAEAKLYCERLVRSHYENFSVATLFLPERLREHFYSVYAYCRISDDLGDEVGNAEQSLRLLDEWETELDVTYASLALSGEKQKTGNGKRATGNDNCSEEHTSNEHVSEGHGFSRAERLCPPDAALAAEGNEQRSPRHPVFIALRETIRACNIPKQPFADLLKAFRQDQVTVRYKTLEDLLGYCRYSANPVGRLVLYVCGYSDRERQHLSDFTCTALQLANFWQDVAVDYGKGRIYLPLEDLRRFGVSEQDIAQRHCTPRFRDLMRFEVARAHEWFVQGLPLVRKVDRELAIDIELFSRGGQEILNAIERQNYDVLTSRPAISKRRKIWLLARAALKSRLP